MWVRVPRLPLADPWSVVSCPLWGTGGADGVPEAGDGTARAAGVLVGGRAGRAAGGARSEAPQVADEVRRVLVRQYLAGGVGVVGEDLFEGLRAAVVKEAGALADTAEGRGETEAALPRNRPTGPAVPPPGSGPASRRPSPAPAAAAAPRGPHARRPGRRRPSGPRGPLPQVRGQPPEPGAGRAGARLRKTGGTSRADSSPGSQALPPNP